jgi:hypothetical protein
VLFVCCVLLYNHCHWVKTHLQLINIMYKFFPIHQSSCHGRCMCLSYRQRRKRIQKRLLLCFVREVCGVDIKGGKCKTSATSRSADCCNRGLATFRSPLTTALMARTRLQDPSLFRWYPGTLQETQILCETNSPELRRLSSNRRAFCRYLFMFILQSSSEFILPSFQQVRLYSVE